MKPTDEEIVRVLVIVIVIERLAGIDDDYEHRFAEHEHEKNLRRLQ